MKKQKGKMPQTTRRHVADANCGNFHYTQEEIDHVLNLQEERNGYFDEFSLLQNNVDDNDYPHLDPNYGGGH